MGHRPKPHNLFETDRKDKTMFDKLIAVVDLTKPVNMTPLPEKPKPKIESQAHKKWVKRKNDFKNHFNNGQEPTGDMITIMVASIGEEPPFE